MTATAGGHLPARRSISGSTISRTLANTFSSGQLPSPTKCSND